jgi:hypothetical protein
MIDNKNLNNHDYNLFDYDYYNNENENCLTGNEFLNDEHKHKFKYKLFILSVILIFFFAFNNYLKGITKSLKSSTGIKNLFDFNSAYNKNVCYNDLVFNQLDFINSNYSEQNYQRHALLIISSVAMDLLVYTSFYVFVNYSTNWVYLISLFIFYSIRQIMLSLFVFRFPQGYIFDLPSISSLTVSYFKTNDFFYSGHIGILVIIYYEFRELMINKFICLIILLVIFLESFTMLALRGHYFVDILFGVIMGIYCYKKANTIEKYFNTSLGICDEKLKLNSKVY